MQPECQKRTARRMLLPTSGKGIWLGNVTASGTADRQSKLGVGDGDNLRLEVQQRGT